MLRLAALAAFVLAGAVWLVTVETTFADFLKAYYPAGVAIVNGNLDELRPLYREVNLVNPPIVGVAFVPLAFLSPDVAGAAFVALGFFSALAAWWVLARTFELSRTNSALLLLLFALNGPLIYSLKLANTTHLMLLLVAVGLAALKAGKPFASGALFGLCALFKPMLLLIGVYFLLRRNWAGVAGGAAVIAIASVASLTIFGADMHREWIEHTILPFLGRPIVAYNNQSLDAFLLRLDLGPEYALEWGPQETSAAHSFLRPVLLAGVVLTAIVAIAASRWTRADQTVEIGLVLAVAVIVSPVSWSHYHCLLLVPWAAMLRTPSLRIVTGGLFGISIVLGSLPLVPFDWQQDYWHTLASAQFLSAITTLAALATIMLWPPASENAGATASRRLREHFPGLRMISRLSIRR